VDEAGGHGREEGRVWFVFAVCVDACYAAHGGFLVVMIILLFLCLR
jgi:hypothetical protein